MQKHLKLLLAGTIIPILVCLVLWIDIPGLKTGGKTALALFVIAAVLWITEIIPLFVTSLIILTGELLWLTPVLQKEGVKVARAEFMEPFFSDIILLFLGGLLISKAGSKHHIDKWIASAVMRITRGKSSLVLLGLILTSAWLSMWMSNTATTAMMLLIAVAVSRGLPEASPFKKALFLCVPFACNLGGIGTPVGSPPNAIALAFLQKQGTSVSFIAWMAASLPILLVMLFLLWRLLLFFYPPPKETIRLEHAVAFPPQWQARGAAIIFVLTVALWLTGKLHGMSSGMVGLIATVLLLSFRILDTKDFLGISWDLLFLVGGGISLGLAMSRSGLSSWMVGVLPLQNLSYLVLFVIFIFTGTIITTFMSSTAAANILIPIAVSLHPRYTPLVMGAALAVTTSMSLPVSTPPNAIAYCSGELTLKDMFKTGAIVSLLSALVLAATGSLYWRLLGLM